MPAESMSLSCEKTAHEGSCRAFSGLFPDDLVHAFNLETEQDDLYNLPPKPLCTQRPSAQLEH